ncbi:hypothetical protein [Flavobacterium sp. LC2016-01]|uniref:hypothetical protein n=1 Tax=Flavobacterium sp. LC2016-01 TaxID=2675876 RepID=UPI0012BAC40F|nr:hypothetical protein [Flavobacterium sp. LC2016-01]MTH15851.1 hypothetical protein [Flavobacterium sp. LC2016-01]
MDNLLQDALHAAGGMEIWKKYSTLTAQIRLKGVKSWLESDPGLLENLTFQADLAGGSAQLRNFPERGLYTIFTNDKTSVFDEKDNPVSAFDPAWGKLFDASLQAPWHAIQMMYFIRYTFWKSLTFPFGLTTEGYEYEQGQILEDNGHLYRSLLVQAPDDSPYGQLMSLFFAQDNLINRTDYETQNEEPVFFTKITSEYAVLNGLIIPTLIQVYHREQDGTYDAENPLIAVEVRSMKFI